jgi:hypothetical protein
MILEMRTYQIQAGKAPEFLKIYQANGLHIITRYAKLIGCWTKESGVLNSVVFLWAYDDFAHRSAQRTKMAQDAEWTAFVPTILPYLVHQESVFLNPVAFSPVRRTGPRGLHRHGAVTLARKMLGLICRIFV